MTTSAEKAFGTQITRNGTVIAELASIGPAGKTLETQDVTTHQSANGYREFIGTLKDGGEIALAGNFIKGDTNGQVGLETDLENRTVQSFVITFAGTAATWTFSALVTKFQIEDMTPDGKQGFTATLRVTGKPVLAITASGGLTGLTGIEENAGGAITFVPAFLAGTTTYAVSVNTASTWIKLTPTAAAHTITISNGTSSQTVTSGAQSGEIDLGAADSVTTVTITATESGKVAQVTTIYVTRPAP